MSAPPAPSALYKYSRDVDARLLYRGEPSFKGIVGPASRTLTRTTPSSLNASSLQATIYNPSPDTAIGRELRFEGAMRASFGFNGQAAVPIGQPVAVYNRDWAVRNDPVSSLIAGGSVQFAGASIDVPLALYKDVVDRLGDPMDKEGPRRGSPSMLARFASNSSAAGTLWNPLAGLADAHEGAFPNGAYPIVFCDAAFTPLSTLGAAGTYVDGAGNTVAWNTIGGQIYLVGNATTAANTVCYCYFTMALSEELSLGPFVRKPSDAYEMPAMVGISQVQLALTLQSASAARLIQSAAGPAGFTLGAVALDATPFASAQLCTTSYSFPVGIPEASRPARQVTPFAYVQATPIIGTSTVAAGATGTLLSPQIPLTRIPRMIVVAVQPTAYADSDATWFAPITQVSLNAFNLPSLLIDASPYELYAMSRKNGVGLSWPEWTGAASLAAGSAARTIGSVLAIQPATDFPIPSLTADIGSGASSYNLQLQVTFTNPTAGALTFKMTIVSVHDNVLAVGADGTVVMTGLSLTEGEVAAAPVHERPAHVGVPHLIAGSLWDMAKHAFGAGKEAVAAVRHVADYVKGKKEGGALRVAGGSRLSMLDRAM